MNQRDALHYIETRQEFKASALSGSHNYLGAGKLNPQEVSKLAGDISELNYLVYSYGTPIAWHTAAGWYVVAQKFSQTTSKHTNAVRRAITSELVGAN